jgi:hypothetical protein
MQRSPKLRHYKSVPVVKKSTVKRSASVLNVLHVVTSDTVGSRVVAARAFDYPIQARVSKQSGSLSRWRCRTPTKSPHKRWGSPTFHTHSRKNHTSLHQLATQAASPINLQRPRSLRHSQKFTAKIVLPRVSLYDPSGLKTDLSKLTIL